jgi:hypothetical protein
MTTRHRRSTLATCCWSDISFCYGYPSAFLFINTPLTTCTAQTGDNTLKLRPSNIKLEQVSSSHPLYLEDAQRMLRRSGVAPTQMRDWAGTVSADVLRRMRGDPELSELCNVLGRHTSQYTAQLLECATADTEILNVGLDLTIWNRRKSGKRMAEQGTFSFPFRAYR